MRRWIRLGKGNGENSIVDLKKYLSTEDQPLTMEEFKEFWESLTEEEKTEFKKMELK
jgi:folate-dependent tRNA-U54 methylase TrmFO/GidA